jgi:DnaK suppressor protein
MKVRERKNLIKKYSDLKDQIIKTLESSDYEVDVDGDIVDKLQGQSLLAVQNQISKKNLLKLKAIESALELIDKDEYGDCQECGEPISMRRLESIPGVTICVLCAELLELHK